MIDTKELRHLDKIVRKILVLHPSLKRKISIDVDHGVVTIEDVNDRFESSMMIKTIRSIVYHHFDGEIKDVQFAVVRSHRYMQFSIVGETARVH